MGSEEFIKFEITEDDLQSEFNINRSRRFTKKQQIYGIWNDSDDDSDDDRRRSSNKVRRSYNTGVNFVAGGIHKPGQKPEEDEEDKEDKVTRVKKIVSVSDSSGDEYDPRPSYSKNSNYDDSDEIAGLRKVGSSFPKSSLFTEKGVGNWEKHTKGIGAKLLLQMGYQPGKGLGKKLQGIQAPIEAHLRKGRGAIGAYGPEVVSKPKTLTPKDETKEIANENVKKLSLWRRENGEAKNRKVRYVYKTLDQILQENRKTKKIELSELSKVKVIDMTGPEQRVLSGYHAISGVQKPEDEWEIRKDKRFDHFSMPELEHNLNLLVDLAEEAIIENNEKIQQSEDKIVVLEKQEISLRNMMKVEEKQIDSFGQMITAIDTVLQDAKKNKLTLDKAADIFSTLKGTHYSEFCTYEMPIVALNIIEPIIKRHVAQWNPLQDPTKPISMFTQWKDIIGLEESSPINATSLNPYHKLLWDTWIPSVRTAVNLWSCRHWAPMVEFIKHWVPVIPNWIMDNVLQDIVLRKIQTEVDTWNPLTDCVPIHTWIYPWINILGKYFDTTVYPAIRQKLGKALVNWHPSDGSARLMLQPWMNVFDRGQMDAFLVNNIVPKLQRSLQELVINPHEQHLGNWNCVMEWSDMIPTHSIAMLLDKFFFPKWIQVLTMWLSMNPDYDQVSRWYTGWKGVMPDKVMGQTIVKEHFRSALDAMSRAVGGPVSANPSLSSSNQRAENLAEAIRMSTKIPQGFRDLVEKRCEERGILWMPIANRYVEGKQVYRCGSVNVYIDRSVLFVCQDGNLFQPLSLQELLRIAA